MSCFGLTYNPTVTRTWSRIQPVCIQSDPPQLLYMQHKGQVLQYKKNSLNITKQQRYAKIARGKWINRNTTWATQSETNTNPNTKSLMRVNYTGTPSCPLLNPFIIPSVLPTNSQNGVPSTPTVPPPPPSGGGGGGQAIPLVPAKQALIQLLPPDGGQLVCNIMQDICTGDILGIAPSQTCFPTSSSDVPGPIIELCYSPLLPNYFPEALS